MLHRCSEIIAEAVDMLEAAGAKPDEVGLGLSIVLCTHAIEHGLTQAQLVHVVTTAFDSAVRLDPRMRHGAKC